MPCVAYDWVKESIKQVRRREEGGKKWRGEEGRRGGERGRRRGGREKKRGGRAMEEGEALVIWYTIIFASLNYTSLQLNPPPPLLNPIMSAGQESALVSSLFEDTEKVTRSSLSQTSLLLFFLLCFCHSLDYVSFPPPHVGNCVPDFVEKRSFSFYPHEGGEA